MATTITLSDDDVKTILDNVHRDVALAIVRGAIRKAQSSRGLPSGITTPNSARTTCTCGSSAGCFLHPRNSPFNSTSGPIRDDHTRDLSSDAVAAFTPGHPAGCDCSGCRSRW